MTGQATRPARPPSDQEAAAHVTDSVGMRIHRATRALNPEGEHA
jgi:hypothetical protein